MSVLPRGWWLVGAFALGTGCSPYGGGSFACTDNTQCAPNGTCTSGFCAFPDPGCPSGLKYGDASGPNSGKCVGAVGNVDAAVVDGPVDADNTPLPDGAICYGNSLVHACFAAAPTGMKTVNAAINTMTSNQCATLVGPNANAWCVIAGSSITVTNTVSVTGNRPLVLLSTGTIDVNGTLDIASHRGGATGAGADVAGCNAGTAPTVQSGGAGGSFGGVGGAGAAAGNGAAGGIPGAALTPSALRGGCPGQNGAGNNAGVAGRGGGAVWLYAATGITVGGTINASGSSGAAPGGSSGGGGGGTGGFVGLECPSITVAGSIFANGGAGSEGSGNISIGNAGTDSPNVTTAAVGGAGGTDFGTDGGNGSLGATLTGSAAATACTGPCSTPVGGGAGGGGAGIIKVVPSQTTGGQLSPPAT